MRIGIFLNTLSDVTLVVHTRNPGDLIPQGFQPAIDLGAHVLIMANGENPIPLDGFRSNGQIRQVHNPDDYVEQIASWPGHVTTRLAMLVDEDSAVLPHALASATTKLRNVEGPRVAVGVPLVLKGFDWGLRLESNPHRQLRHSMDAPSDGVPERLADLAQLWRSRSWYSLMSTELAGTIFPVAAWCLKNTACPSTGEVAVEVFERTLTSAIPTGLAFNVRSLIRPTHEYPIGQRHLSYHRWRSNSAYMGEYREFEKTILASVASRWHEEVRDCLATTADDNTPKFDRARLVIDGVRSRLRRSFRVRQHARPEIPRLSPNVLRCIHAADVPVLTTWVTASRDLWR